MKRIILALLVVSSSAMAGENRNTGPGTGPATDARAMAGAVATSSAVNRTKATGGNATGGSVRGGNVTVTNSNGGGSGDGGGGGGRGGGDNYLVTTPDGHGMAPCGGGLGLGAVLASFGGTLWEFQECKIIREASLLKSWGYHDAAIAELCQIPRVEKAFGGKCPAAGQAPTPVIDRTAYRYDWCYTRNPGDKDQHKECETRN